MRFRVALLSTVLMSGAIAATVSTRAQTMHTDDHSLVRDPGKPFVYLKFDHIGPGVRRSENEPAARIWLRFVNNSNTSIQLRAYGTPEGSLTGEIGVMDDVVLDPPMLTITSDAPSINVETGPRTDNKPPGRAKGTEVPESSKMPLGYQSEVSGSVTVAPGDSILFSVPISHVGTRNSGWHLEIPFKFVVPRTQGFRDPLIGGEPILTLWYSHYDLPDEAKAAIEKLQ